MKRAESIEFVADENGWEMHVTTEDGFVQRFNVHGITYRLLAAVNDSIGNYYREGMRAAASHVEEPETDFDLARDIARDK